mgnify:CR=1 FL=1
MSAPSRRYSPSPVPLSALLPLPPAAAQAPAAYPYSIALTGNNPAVEDVELLNPFNGISAVGAARHYIARVQGQPANVGIFIDQTYDIGRVEVRT